MGLQPLTWRSDIAFTVPSVATKQKHVKVKDSLIIFETLYDWTSNVWSCLGVKTYHVCILVSLWLVRKWTWKPFFNRSTLTWYTKSCESLSQTWLYIKPNFKVFERKWFCWFRGESPRTACTVAVPESASSLSSFPSSSTKRKLDMLTLCNVSFVTTRRNLLKKLIKLHMQKKRELQDMGGRIKETIE